MKADDANDAALSREGLGRNLTYGLLENLGRSIVKGTYREQPFPTEGNLAIQFGVSRSVTREAVKMLAAKGLLGARSKQGTFVLPETAWNLFDTDVLQWLLEGQASVLLLQRFNELRLGVEPQAAALAATRGTPEQLEAIAYGLARMEAAETGADDTLSADIAFHVAILHASQNPFFVQFRQVVMTALRTSIRFTNQLADRNPNIAEHARIYDAIRARDPAAARRNMTFMIENVLKLIEPLVARENAQP